MWLGGWEGEELPSGGETDVDQEGEAGRGARMPGAMLQQLLSRGGLGPWAGDRSWVAPPQAWHPSALLMLTPGLAVLTRGTVSFLPSSFFLRQCSWLWRSTRSMGKTCFCR